MRSLLLASTALAALAGPAAAEFALTILHVNDLHSRLEPISKYDGTCSAEDDAAGECFGGVARLKTIVEARRAAAEAEGSAALLLDAGDQFQGSLMYTTYKGAAEAEFMEAIGFDAMAVGNHEFDDGPEGLAGFLDAVSFPVISGNLDVSASAPLAGKIAPHVVLEVGGERVGIVLDTSLKVSLASGSCIPAVLAVVVAGALGLSLLSVFGASCQGDSRVGRGPRT